MNITFNFPVTPETFAAHQEKLCGFPIRGKLREITDTWVENINVAYEEGRANDVAGLQNSLDIMEQLIAKNRYRPVALKLLKAARHWVIYAWKQGQKEREE